MICVSDTDARSVYQITHFALTRHSQPQHLVRRSLRNTSLSRAQKVALIRRFQSSRPSFANLSKEPRWYGGAVVMFVTVRGRWKRPHSGNALLSMWFVPSRKARNSHKKTYE